MKQVDRLHDESDAHRPPVVAPMSPAAYNADVGRIRRLARDMGLSGPRSIQPARVPARGGPFFGSCGTV